MCRSKRSSALITDKVGDPSLTLDAEGGSRPGRAGSESHQALGHSPVQSSAARDGDDPGERRPAVGDCEFVAVAHLVEVFAQSTPQLSDPDLHDLSVHECHRLAYTVLNRDGDDRSSPRPPAIPFPPVHAGTTGEDGSAVGR
jgi:hypothetical protein